MVKILLMIFGKSIAEALVVEFNDNGADAFNIFDILNLKPQ